MLLEHHGTQGLLTLWVALVNAGGAGGTLLVSSRDPSPPALDAWLAGACLAAAGCLLLPAGWLLPADWLNRKVTGSV